MKAIGLLNGIVFWLIASQALGQQGLKGDYYVGTNFERKVFTRMDPQLNFNWRGQSPAPGLSESYYSIRWTGKLLAPASGQYRFYAKVDDGIRVWVGNRLVINSWQLNDSENFGGSVILEAGKFYDFRVDFFNDMLEGEIFLYWQRPDARKAGLERFTQSGELIAAQYFRQRATPPVLPPPTVKPTAPIAVVSKLQPKTVPPKSPEVVSPKPVAKAKPVSTPPPSGSIISNKTLPASSPVPNVEQPLVLAPGETFVLHHVQFEQSSYNLLPESSTELDQVVVALKKNPLWQINIAGHTDNVGDPRLNLALSENRAKVVASYLKRHGIAEERITTNGYGGTQPVADNSIERERSKNRRVEITIK